EKGTRGVPSSVTPFLVRNCLRRSGSLPDASITTAVGADLTIGMTSVLPAPRAVWSGKDAIVNRTTPRNTVIEEDRTRTTIGRQHLSEPAGPESPIPQSRVRRRMP